MSSKFGRAGKSARELADRRNLIRASLGLAALLVGWIFFKVLPHAQGMDIGALVVLVLAFIAAMRFLNSKVTTKIAEEKRAVRGAKAEEKVEEILDQLDGEHLVFHDVRCQFGNIDHIVLSKAHGVFLIETKAHGGRVAVIDSKIRVNGKLPETDFIAQTLRNTYWLIEEIKSVTGIDAWIDPLIVFTNAFVEPSRPLKGITITNREFLLSTIQRNGKPIQVKLWEAREKIAAVLTGTGQEMATAKETVTGR